MSQVTVSGLMKYNFVSGHIRIIATVDSEDNSRDSFTISNSHNGEVVTFYGKESVGEFLHGMLEVLKAIK